MSYRKFEWMDSALCAQVDPEVFFPEQGERPEEAWKICARCPVRSECEDYAVSLPQTGLSGTWAGHTKKSRLAERKRRRAVV